MITQEKLNDIYDGGEGPGDPVADVPKVPTMRQSAGTGADPGIPVMRPSTNDAAHVSNLPTEDYTGYLKGGIYEDQGDVDLRRGMAQSAWDKWGNMIARVVPKVALGLVENVGYLGSLAGEQGDDRDYSNALTQAAVEGKNWIDSKLPIYRTSNDTFGLTDAGWWAENIGNLAESAGSFAVEGIGLAKLFGTVGKAAELITANRKALSVAHKAEELLTSGGLAYTEGAQMGKAVFDKTYQAQLDKGIASGLDYDEAHKQATHIAAQSAATTVQLNTMINTGLNLEMLHGAFDHSEDAIQKYWKANSKQLEGETYDQFANRIRTSTNIGDKAVQNEVLGHSGLKHYAVGALSEGVEELTNNFAQTTGEQLGQQWDPKTKTGRTRGLFDQLGELSHYFDRTMDANGALSFVLGAIGGVAQSGLIDNIPIHKTYALDPTTGKPISTDQVDAQGNKIYQETRVSARTKGKYQDTQYFNNVRDAVIEDLGHIEDLKAKIKIARDTGHTDQADAYGDQLFNTMNYNAVRMGMGANYAQTFKEIQNTDNDTIGEDGKTDAMRAGYTTSTTDNAYKAKAEEAVKTLKALEDIHSKVQAKYGGSENPAIERMADIIANRRMSLYTQQQRINKLEQQVNAQELDHQTALSEAGTSLDVDGINSEIIQHNNNVQVATETQARLKSQDKLIEKALQVLAVNPSDPAANAVIDNLTRKYQLAEESDPRVAITQLRERLLRKHTEAAQAAQTSQDALFNSTGYTKWLEKNPNKKFDDFTELVSKRYSLDKALLLKKAFLEDQKLEHQEGTARLAEIESSRGLPKLQKQYEALYKELIRKSTEQQQKDLLETAKRAHQVVATAEQLLKSKNRLQQKYQNVLIKLHQQLDDLTKALQRTNDQIQSLVGKIHFDTVDKNKWAGLSFDKHRQEESLERIKEAIHKTQSLFNSTSEGVEQLKEELDTPEVAPKDAVPDNDTQPHDATTTIPEGPDEVVLPDEPQPGPEEIIAETTKDIPKAPDPDMRAVAEARDNYIFELTVAPHAIQQTVQKYEKQLETSHLPVDMDHLLPQVQSGTVSVHDAGRILSALRDYLQSVDNLNRGIQGVQQDITAVADTTANLISGNQVAPQSVNENVVEEAGVIFPPDSAVTLTQDDTAIPDDSTEHTGAKTENVIKVQTMGLDYVEFKDPNTGDYRMHSLVNKLNPNINPDVLDPKRLPPGTPAVLAIDTDWNGETNIDDILATSDEGFRIRKSESIHDYVGGDGHIRTDDHSIFNVPIKIMDVDGKTIGWLPRMDWVTASYEGATGPEKYRNVVQYKKIGDATIDNMAIQVRDLTRVRRLIIAAHNQGKANVETVTLTKGAGTAIKNIKVNLNTETTVKTTRDDKKVTKLQLERTSKLLPDTKLKLGIVVRGASGNQLAVGYSANTKEVVSYSGNLAFDPEELEQYNNLPVAILPGANGDAHIAPLLSRKLYTEGGQQSDFNTLVRAIEVFIGASSDDLDAKAAFRAEAGKILAKTNFDITNEQGLSDFINQYITHTKNFDDSLIAATVDQEGKSPLEFNLKVEPRIGSQSRGSVKIGTTFSGQKVQSAFLTNGKLDPNFVQVLKEGLGNRYKNVVFERDNLKGLQSDGPFVGPKFRSNGVWAFENHDSYNDYVKANTQSYMVGTNQINGQYVYAVNPQITLNVQKMMDSFQPRVLETAIPDPIANQEATKTYSKSLEKELGELSDAMVQQTEPGTTIENTVQQEDTASYAPVTMKSLTELYGRTNEEARNGKIPAEVFKDLQRLGIPYLSTDYNPFSRCL